MVLEDRCWSPNPRMTCIKCDAELIASLSRTQAMARATETQSHIWYRVQIPECAQCQQDYFFTQAKTEVTLYVQNTVWNKVMSAGLAGRTAGARLTVTNSNMKLAATPCLQPSDMKRDGPYCAAIQMLLPEVIALSSRPIGKARWPFPFCCSSREPSWRERSGMELISYGWETVVPCGSPAQPRPPRQLAEDAAFVRPPLGGDANAEHTNAGAEESLSQLQDTEPSALTTPEEQHTSAAETLAGGTLVACIAPALSLSDDVPHCTTDQREKHSTDSPPNGQCVPVGMRILPEIAEKKYYSNTRANVEDAIEGRITSKKVKFTATAREKGEISRMVHALQTQAFGEKRVRDVVSTILFEDLKSKKWTMSRVENAMNQLHSRYSPGMQFTCSIKLEPMPSGKPPRLLIADGDSGQVKSWLVIGTLERLLFDHFKDNSIKQGSKAEAMQLHEAHMRIQKTKVHIMENDGSAWDACCRKPLRDLIEVPIIEHIIKILDEVVIAENEWSHHRIKADKLTSLKLRFQPKIRLTDPDPDYTQEEIECSAMNKPIFLKIEAIRRSGDRGTSCLNFLTNYVCWAWVLCGGKSCCLMVRGRTKAVPLYNGAQCTVRIKCEGDDSHVMTTYGFTPDEFDEMDARWKRLGHRPKLFLREPGSVTEFTGYHFLVDEHGIVPDSGCPDIVRTMIACSSTLSKAAVRSANGDDDERELASIASASLLCTAAAFSKRLPSLAQFYFRVSKQWMEHGNITHHELTHDQLMKLCPEVKEELFPERWKLQDATAKILAAGSKVGDISHRVECDLSGADLGEESRHVAAKGVCSAEEWKKVIAMHMDVGMDTDMWTYRQALRDILQPTPQT